MVGVGKHKHVDEFAQQHDLQAPMEFNFTNN